MHRDIDLIIDGVAQKLPSAIVTQIKPNHPVDDDGLWWFSLPGVASEIQIESFDGTCPFLVETDEQCCRTALRASTVEQAVRFISDYLNAASEGRPIQLEGKQYWV